MDSKIQEPLRDPAEHMTGGDMLIGSQPAGKEIAEAKLNPAVLTNFMDLRGLEKYLEPLHRFLQDLKELKKRVAELGATAEAPLNGLMKYLRRLGREAPVVIDAGIQIEIMPSKSSKSSTAAKPKGKHANLVIESQDEMELPPKEAINEKKSEVNGNGTPEVAVEAVDNRSLEEILNSIPPPPPPAMTNEPGAPRLMITHIVNRNFKSYAGERVLGPFHKEGDDYEVIPNSTFYVSRTAYKDNSSVYHINSKKANFKDVGALLRSHGIDLDHNRFLILQGEVEQIAMMKPKGQTEHDEGMLEYLEDIIGSQRLKEPIQILCRRVELLNEHRGEKLNRVKMVEKEKDSLEGEKNRAIDYDLQRTVNDQELQKKAIIDDTKELNEKSTKLAEEMNVKNKLIKNVEKKMGKITKYIEEKKGKFAELDLQDVDVREKLKNSKSKLKKLQKQLQKDKEKVDELKDVPANSERKIQEATRKKEEMEKQKIVEEEKLKKVMESLKQETQGLQQEKEGDLGAIDEKYDVAISSSCGALDSILVDTIDTAQICVNFLKSQKVGVATFIGLDKLDNMEKELQKDFAAAKACQEQKVHLEEKVHTLRQNIREMKNTLEKYTASIQSMSEQEFQLKTQIKELEANVVAAVPDKTKQKQLEATVETLKSAFENAAAKASKVEAEVKRLHKLIVDINNHKCKAQQDKLDEVNKEIDECTSVITKAQVAIKTAGRNFKKAEDAVVRTNQEIVDCDKLIEEFTQSLKKLEDEATVIMNECKEAEPLEELNVMTQEELEATTDPVAINNQIVLLESKCLEMKPNLGAIAEYKKKEELYLQRVAELDEITNERDNFRRAYEDLRKRRLNEFMAGFNIITNKLKENYQMLTLGGDAELELVDSLDPFSEGIMFRWWGDPAGMLRKTGGGLTPNPRPHGGNRPAGYGDHGYKSLKLNPGPQHCHIRKCWGEEDRGHPECFQVRSQPFRHTGECRWKIVGRHLEHIWVIIKRAVLVSGEEKDKVLERQGGGLKRVRHLIVGLDFWGLWGCVCTL
ncbi:SMC4 protein, partial [Polypterus senegalus]